MTGSASLFVLGPNTLLSAVGLLRGPDPTVPTPAERWQDARVEVVIAADRQQHDIVYCLAGLLRQSLRPESVVLIDDGGSDRDGTAQIAREFARANGLKLSVIEQTWSFGRTSTIKRQAREFKGDVQVVLDAGTVLESPDYIERCVRELYQGVGIASACGTLLPLRGHDRRRWAQSAEFARWIGQDVYLDPALRRDWLHRLLWWMGNSYRESVGAVQQRFFNRGHMALFGGIGHPVGAAVAYRRQYLKDLFDRYEPLYGDELTALPDLFIAFALSNEGYRNVQVAEVQARALGPEIQHMPQLTWRAIAAFLQSCRDFDGLLRTPLRWPRRWWRQRRDRARAQAPRWRDARRIAEAYRQPFGERLTRQQGRPIGWALFFVAIEKIAFPLGLLLLAASGWWLALALIIAAECLLSLGVLLAVSPSAPARTLLKGVLTIPLRYGLMLVELVTVVDFILRRPVRTDRRRQRDLESLEDPNT
ncbi:glycosyltransferase [Lysobacter sp. D1-1-M9]|uniref:glycosyltransferase n=3 Tax=Novilysobacter TaxID=3382699 RepID=UPI003983B08F